MPIDIKSLDGLKYVKGTTFRFIAKIKEKETDTVSKLYTSEKYFKNLEASIKESNPYFVNKSFDEIFIIEVYLDSFVQYFESYIPKEYLAGVSVLKNNFINKDKSIDYDAFVKFLDWIVALPTLKEIDTNGVILPELLINVKTFSIDHEKAYFFPNEIQTPETNEAITKREEKLKNTNPEILAKISEIKTKLNKINTDILVYKEYIAQDDYENIGLSRSELVVVGQLETRTYTSGKHFLNRRKQNDDIRRDLTSYLNKLSSMKATLELDLDALDKAGG